MNKAPDISIGWLVVIKHMERVAGALLVVNVGVLDTVRLRITDIIR